LMTLPGVEFARRYLRHVLPSGLRSVRYYGFCHPAAKASRLRVQLHSARAVELGHTPPEDLLDSLPDCSAPPCPKCGHPTKLVLSVRAYYSGRDPPPNPPAIPANPSLAA
jgi:hypothetical protein